MRKFFTLMFLAVSALTVSARQLYLCGDAPVGNGWNPTDAGQVPMTLAADGVTNTASFDVSGSAWFCVSIGGGANWDDFNANYRYSCSSFSAQSGTYQFEKLGDHAVSLTSGHYEISINSETMVMTLTVTPVAPPTTNSYHVVGGPFALQWVPALAEQKMEEVSTNVYQLVMENVSIAEVPATLWWRILVNSETYGWSNQYGANGYNKQTSGDDDNIVTQFEEEGIYTFTFTLDLSNGEASVPTLSYVKTGDIKYNYIFVDDQTGWNPLKLYAWGDAGEIFGTWGTTTVTGTEPTDVDGTTYYKIAYGPKEGAEANLIFFNGDGDTGDGDPTRSYITITADQDYYLRVTSGNVEVVTFPASILFEREFVKEQRSTVCLPFSLSEEDMGSADFSGWKGRSS